MKPRELLKECTQKLPNLKEGDVVMGQNHNSLAW